MGVDVNERTMVIVKQWANGMSYAAIARAHGICRNRPSAIVRHAMRKMKGDRIQPEHPDLEDLLLRARTNGARGAEDALLWLAYWRRLREGARHG